MNFRKIRTTHKDLHMSRLTRFAVLIFLSLFLVQAAGASGTKSAQKSAAQSERAASPSNPKPVRKSALEPQKSAALIANPVQKKALGPDKIEQIQMVGRAVLATRRAEPPSPAMEQLRQQVNELRQAITQLPAAPARTGNIPEISIESEKKAGKDGRSGKTVDASGTNAEAPDARESNIRAVLEQLRRQREAVELETQESVTERDHTLERNAAAKVRQLEDEVEKALRAPAEERDKELLTLRERLKIGPRPTIPGKPKSPGIRTIASQGREQQ
jgi:hypothetical protein